MIHYNHSRLFPKTALERPRTRNLSSVPSNYIFHRQPRDKWNLNQSFGWGRAGFAWKEARKRMSRSLYISQSPKVIWKKSANGRQTFSSMKALIASILKRRNTSLRAYPVSYTFANHLRVLWTLEHFQFNWNRRLNFWVTWDARGFRRTLTWKFFDYERTAIRTWLYE